MGNGQAVNTDNEYQQGNHGEVEYPRRGITVEFFSASEIVEHKSSQQYDDTQQDKQKLAFQGPWFEWSEQG